MNRINSFHASNYLSALQDIAANAKINVDDPDVAFLLEGGFAYYNKEGKFLGAMSTATRDTEYYMHFGEPMRLSPEDAERYDPIVK